jgi:hypothetical protein
MLLDPAATVRPSRTPAPAEDKVQRKPAPATGAGTASPGSSSPRCASLGSEHVQQQHEEVQGGVLLTTRPKQPRCGAGFDRRFDRHGRRAASGKRARAAVTGARAHGSWALRDTLLPGVLLVLAALALLGATGPAHQQRRFVGQRSRRPATAATERAEARVR